MESCSAKCQLLALPFYVDDPAHQTWAALSNACHHHAYDLSPTAVELRDWLDSTQTVIDTLTQATVVPG
jgi:hypothetical protein